MSDKASSTPTVDEDVEKIIDGIRAREEAFLEAIKVGDIVYVTDTKKFTFSEFEYCTRFKGYEVIGRSVHGDSVQCKTNIVGETMYVSGLDVSHATRNGQPCWESRNMVSWKYRDDIECGKDRYGFGVNDDTWFGRLVQTHYPDMEEWSQQQNDDGTTYLVQLLVPFRDGEIGDLIVVNCNDLQVTVGQDVY